MNQVPAPVVHEQRVGGGRGAAAGGPPDERGPFVGQAQGCQVVGRAEHAIGRVVGMQIFAGEDVEGGPHALHAGHGVAREPVGRGPRGKPEARSVVKACQTVVRGAQQELVARDGHVRDAVGVQGVGGAPR